MLRRFLSRLSGVGRPDPDALFREIAQAHPGRYTDIDRYRDFRAVFLGSDQGKRVFHEILTWGHMFRSSLHASPIDPLRLAAEEGERQIALRLLATIHAEPSDKPEQVRKPKWPKRPPNQ